MVRQCQCHVHGSSGEPAGAHAPWCVVGGGSERRVMESETRARAGPAARARDRAEEHQGRRARCRVAAGGMHAAGGGGGSRCRADCGDRMRLTRTSDELNSAAPQGHNQQAQHCTACIDAVDVRSPHSTQRWRCSGLQNRAFGMMTTDGINIASAAISAHAEHATGTHNTAQRKHVDDTRDGSCGCGGTHLGAAIRAAQCRRMSTFSASPGA